MVLTDTDPMPFSMHKGKEMANVPSNWLKWYWGENVHDYVNGRFMYDNQKAVMAYIEDSFTNLPGL